MIRIKFFFFFVKELIRIMDLSGFSDDKGIAFGLTLLAKKLFGNSLIWEIIIWPTVS